MFGMGGDRKKVAEQVPPVTVRTVLGRVARIGLLGQQGFVGYYELAIEGNGRIYQVYSRYTASPDDNRDFLTMTRAGDRVSLEVSEQTTLASNFQNLTAREEAQRNWTPLQDSRGGPQSTSAAP